MRVRSLWLNRFPVHVHFLSRNVVGEAFYSTQYRTMAANFAAAVERVTTYTDRAVVEGTALALVHAVLETALNPVADPSAGGDASDGAGGGAMDDGSSSVSLTAQPYVTLLGTTLDAACDAANYARGYAMLLCCDAALRLGEAAVTQQATHIKPELLAEELAALADAVPALIRSDVGQRAPAMVARLRQAAAGQLPPGIAAGLKAVVKDWRKKRMLDPEVLEAVAAAASGSGGAGGEGGGGKRPRGKDAEEAAEAAGAAAEHAIDVDDGGLAGAASRARQQPSAEGTAAPPPPTKATVKAVAALLSETLDTLAALPPAVAAPLWARMPAGAAFDPLRDGEALAAIRAVLSDAVAARALNRAAIASAGKKNVAGSAGAGNDGAAGAAGRGAGRLAVLTRAPTAPQRLLTDARKPEVAHVKELPRAKELRRLKPSQYSFPPSLLAAATATTSGGGSGSSSVVGRRAWGVSSETWAAAPDLAVAAPGVITAQAVPNSGAILMLMAAGGGQ